MPLADVQQRVRDAMVLGRDAGEELGLVAGAADGGRRLAIHRRHYETSLITALLRRYPATGWLLGSPLLLDAARTFVRRHPPTAPCIAEYGGGFPHFLAARPELAGRPYAGDFATLDWLLGRVSVEVAEPAVTADALLRLSGEALADSVLVLQPGLHYVTAAWPIDDLMRMYLTNSAPERLVVVPTGVRLEVRGARGEVGFSRLTEADFTFRRAVRAGLALGNAAEDAVAIDAGFDPGRALAALFSAELVTSVGAADTESFS